MNANMIWFTSPAQNWLQCLPVGNGHIGCMISGDPFCNTLSLNDDTLWSGYQRDYHKADFQQNLQEVRRLMLENKRAQAEEIVETRLTNRFTQAYLPLGDLLIRSREGGILDYHRALDLASGVARARFLRDGKSVFCETFVSYPDDVLVHTTNSEAPEDYEISFTCELMHEVTYDNEGITLTGYAPNDLIIGDVGNFASSANQLCYDEPEKSMRFAVRAQMITDGMIESRENHISIIGARRVMIVLSSATSYAKGDAYLTHCIETTRIAARRDLRDIKGAHLLDHSALFNRVQLDLGADGNEDSCEERLARMRCGETKGSDISLLFQYGRYLLIASSRRGTQAANLQGIWNRDVIPPWWSGYTLNINLQMNYWLTDRTNLSDCFGPFVSYTERLCEAGKQTASVNYGAEGSVAHHQSDIWAHSTPVGLDRVRIPQSARYMMWNMSLPWLCLQMYDHYLYHLDKQFLESELYPMMKSSADFIKSTFTRIGGRLYNIPSTSPENMYRDEAGRELAICNMSAMDIAITKEFCLAFANVCRMLDQASAAEYWTQFANEVCDYTVSSTGALREWDGDFEETERGHRHFSMLFGIYPGNSLIGSAYESAARKSLNARLECGSGQTGWSAVWATLLLARFGEGDAAYDTLLKLMRENIHDNLFGAHPPDLFQIDASFGITIAVSEMILQEINGVIRLLPALPKALPSGSLTGLKVHGGHEISLAWKNSKVEWVEIIAARDDAITIEANGLFSNEVGDRVSGRALRVPLRQSEHYRFFRVSDL